jgi:hypothetical protein
LAPRNGRRPVLRCLGLEPRLPFRIYAHRPELAPPDVNEIPVLITCHASEPIDYQDLAGGVELNPLACLECAGFPCA